MSKLIKTVDFKIEGMSCVACSKSAQRSLKKTRGVVSASVNIATEKAIVEYDTSECSFEDLKHSVEKVCFHIAKEEKNDFQSKEENNKRSFLVAVIFAALVFLFFLQLI